MARRTKQDAQATREALLDAAEREGELIDDVTTTHSTLLACAMALQAAGAKQIFAACATAAVHTNRGKLEDEESDE